MEKRIVLITGGNKGLGYETAKQLVTLGYKVYIGCRNEEKGLIASKELNCNLVLMDVTDNTSVTKAKDYIEEKEGHIDILINNAGVSGIRKKVEDITAEDMEKVFNTNVFGIVRVSNAFIPLLKKSNNPVIVNVSSGLGSFGMVTNPFNDESKVNSLTYSSSKSAVSMLTVQYAKGLTTMHINAVDPGSTATDLNNGYGKKTVQEGAKVIIKLATIDKEGPTGKFFNEHGEIPW